VLTRTVRLGPDPVVVRPVQAVGTDPGDRFVPQEGRDPSAAFDTNGYLAANPDVAAGHVNPLDHYLLNGIYEGRAAVNDALWNT